MEDNVALDEDMFKLTTNNYSYWKPMMEDHLYCRDLHEPIIYKDNAEGKSDAQWELLNRKAVVMIRNILNIAYDDNSWIVDSGSSFYVTPHRSFFSSYRSSDFGTVQMRKQDMSKIIGIEDIILTTSTGCKLILKDMRHVPAMRLNLISAGKLDDAGLINYFGKGKWKLTKGNLIMARGKKERSLYMMQAKLYKEEVWVHLLKSNDQVLDAFKEFHALVECETRRKIKCVRSDNGGEYRGHFEAYCKKYDIRLERTPPKTPQLNGLA
ncbi:hypothetical protein F3Y22_tig00112925pilonHSYRG00085 [Hibiscus syriacus]|uniref:Integrase catalytic domain-containing protein n=1 Tax=Hibiscus syriacus TaxID=106335 RepID=A0A6A2WSU0_HIBSY|nr:hypothetical protein F3Y22_tig00112925pilonHSYRG00085 [Hibiscus syriacus]